jgi:phage terminase large subunit-like protein
MSPFKRKVKMPPHGFRVISLLQKSGLRLTEFPQTIPNLTAMSQNLYDLIEFGNLKLYPDRELRREATMTVGKERGRGLRIVKEKSTHKIDQIVALAMGSYAASQIKPRPTPMAFPLGIQRESAQILKGY